MCFRRFNYKVGSRNVKCHFFPPCIYCNMLKYVNVKKYVMLKCSVPPGMCSRFSVRSNCMCSSVKRSNGTAESAISVHDIPV